MINEEEAPGPMTTDRPFISITPSDWLRFTKEKRKQQIKLQNLTKKRVAFKVRITGFQYFNLIPNLGFVEPNGSTTIQVTLLDNYVAQRQERFIIMAADPKGEENRKNVWDKYLPTSTDVQKHKLFISLPTEVVTKVVQNYITLPQKPAEVDDAKEANRRITELARDITKLQKEKAAKAMAATKKQRTSEPSSSSRRTNEDAPKQQHLIYFVLILFIVLLVGYELGGTESSRPGARSYY